MAVMQVNIGRDGTPAREYRFDNVTAGGRWQVVTGHGDDLLGLPGTKIFIRDLTTGVVEAAAFTLTGEMVADAMHGIISADGRYVIHTSAQDNIVACDTNGVADVFRYDRVTKTTELLVVDQNGEAGYQAGADLVVDLGFATGVPATGLGFII